MQFEITKEFLNELNEAVAAENFKHIRAQLEELHPADIAEILDKIPIENARLIFKQFEDEQGADILVELEEDVREKLLEGLSSKAIANQIEFLDTDDAADVLAELTEDQKAEVIMHIEDEEHSRDVSQLMTYDEDSAGGLMATEFIRANVNWPVNRCVVMMRQQAEEVDKVYTIYVVDDEGKLMGTLSLKSLLFASPRTLIKDLYMEGVVSVPATMEGEEVAKIMQKYDLVVLPVVDEFDRLIGRITIDDVLDFVKEEADKDYQMASGLSEKVESHDSVWRLSRARLPWLLIGMLGGILGALVIGEYEEQLKIRPELAFFVPLVAAMGGNVGVQSSAIVVQGLANKSIVFSGILGRIGKETLVGLVNGLVCGALVLGYNLVVGNGESLAYTVSLALFAVIMFAAVFGTFIPLVLDKYKIDPALATGPFITTVNDVLGLFVYFVIGRIMYGI